LLPIAAILVQADGFLGFVATVTRFRVRIKPLRKTYIWRAQRDERERDHSFCR
jgi:hypothetical protein